MSVIAHVPDGGRLRRLSKSLRRDIGWWWLVLPCAAVVGVATTLIIAYPVVVPAGNDWRIMERAVLNLSTNPYESGTYVYTPLLTHLFAWTLLPLGLWVTMAAHLAVLPLLRGPLLIAVVLATPAFWMTVALGNVFWFGIVFGLLALRGSRWAMIATVLMFVLLPRPIMLPLVAWLVWKEPVARLPALAIAAAAVVLNLATGYADEWFTAALSFSADPRFRDAWDWGPTHALGSWWLIVGVPLAAWLTYRGQVGWAGLAMSPYLVPPAFLVLLFELPGRDRDWWPPKGRRPPPTSARAATSPSRLAISG